MDGQFSNLNAHPPNYPHIVIVRIISILYAYCLPLCTAEIFDENTEYL